MAARLEGSGESARHEVALFVARQAEEALGDDVAHDLVRATADGGRLRVQQLGAPAVALGVGWFPGGGVHAGDVGGHQRGLLHELGHGQLEHRRRRAVTGARLDLQVAREVPEHHLADAQLHQLVAQHRAVREVAPLGLGRQRGEAALAPTARAHAAQRLALEGQHGAGHPPAVVDVAQDVGHRHPHPVQEHLVEVGFAGHLTQRPDGDARRAHVDDEHRDALALGARRIAAGQAGGVVAVLRARGPHLLPVEHELVTVAVGPGLHAREVRAGTGLAEELAPDVFAPQQRRDQRLFLCVAAMHEQRRAAHAEPDLEGAGWDLERLGLAVEDALEPARQPATAVGDGPGDAGQPGLGQLALEGDGTGHARARPSRPPPPWAEASPARR